MNLRPWYNKDANFQTNAKSFMDYLARTNKFLEVLIEDYEIFQELVIEELERIKFDSEIAVEDIFYKWSKDGTLEKIINRVLMNQKVEIHVSKDEPITDFPNSYWYHDVGNSGIQTSIYKYNV